MVLGASSLAQIQEGSLILDSSGRYAQMQMRSDRPKFESNNRLQGTADENSAIVHGTVAFFGTWSVDEATKTLIMKLDESMFPNQVGEVSRRPVILNGDEMR